MKNKSLGRLEKINLRDIWTNESGEFTPWLAEEDNLKLLGDTIGIDLELEAQEKDVGPFKADMLCRDTGSDHLVLVENQLEKTDHTHLGQLMTYAAGLSAVTIVWAAQRFTEEHRAALDWLNNITSGEINFFGLEVELWKIGDSPVAPKFNIVSKPNDWVKSGSGARSQFESGSLSETRKMQLEFWTAFKEYILDRDSVVKPQKPFPNHWMSFAIGRSGFWTNALINTRDNRVWCELTLGGPDKSKFFSMLQSEKDKIEAEFGDSLNWRDTPVQKHAHISITYENVDPTDREKWPDLQRWLAEKLEAFHNVFSHRIKNLNIEDYSRDQDD